MCDRVIFAFVFLTILLSVILHLMNRYRRLSVASGIAAVCALVGFGTPLLTAPMLNWIQSDAEAVIAPADWGSDSTIILLGMGTTKGPDSKYEVAPLSFGRVATAASSFRACVQSGARCRILVTGGVQGQRDDEAKVYAAKLVSLGVPEADILLERRSRSTWENAKFSRSHVDRLPEGRLYLVTSAVHMRRALIYFRHWGMRPTPIRADYVEPWPMYVPMAFNIALSDLVLSEVKGIMRFNVYNLLGWNEAAAPPAKSTPTSQKRALL